MSIQSEIDRLQAAKSAIAAALQAMGVEPPQGTTLDQYAAQLTAIAASAPWLPLTSETGVTVSAKGSMIFSGGKFGESSAALTDSNIILRYEGVDAINDVVISEEAIKLNGPVKVIGSLETPNPTSSNQASNKGYVDGLVGDINSMLDAINGEVV